MTYYGLTRDQADFLTGSMAWGDLLEGLVAEGIPPKLAAKWLINVHPREDNDEPVYPASSLVEFFHVLVACGEIKRYLKVTPELELIDM